MILVKKGNFFVQSIVKEHDSSSAPKSTFYADFKVCLALEGDAVWEIENDSYHVRAGDILFLSMGQKRHFTSFGKDGFKFCAFTLRRNAFAGQHHFIFFGEYIKQHGNLIRNPVLSRLLTDVYREWEAESALRYELISAGLTMFFIKAERIAGYTIRSISDDHRRMLEIMDYIDNNISSDVSLRTVSQMAGLTESSFSRRFMDTNGISFKQYVVEKKIQRAITLLQTTDRTVIDIALDCGFDSISGFYSAFRKKTGTTPNKFSEFEN